MNIRKAELNDIKSIKEITDVLYLKIPHFVWNTEDFVAKQISRGEYFLLEKPILSGGNVSQALAKTAPGALLDTDGKHDIMGVISLRPRANRIQIETLAIRNGFNSNGFGTELIHFAKQFAKEGGFGLLHAYSFYEYNIKDFYLKQGFSLLDYSGSYHGHHYHCMEMKIS